MTSSPTMPASQAPPRRKQLKEGMEHLRGFVTVTDASSTSAVSPSTADQGEAKDTEEGKGSAQDAYGVPSTLEPVRRPRDPNYPPENDLKRSDPFQFGSRYLAEDDDIFAFNAWDHVEVDEAYRSFADECYARQRENPVSDFDRRRFNESPEKQWNKFYANNTANFFKDRKWLRQEFPVLSEIISKDAGRKVVLEVGAGAGNTAFPILKHSENEKLEIWACDFSATAVGVIREHEEYRNSQNKGTIEARVWDAAAIDTNEVVEDRKPYSLPAGLEAGTVDVLIMIFIFSALSPEQWEQAVRNAWHALKPGGAVLFRDYGRGDLAQVRFKKERWMGENFYVRGDGTRVYFFEEEELRKVWTAAAAAAAAQGGFQVESSGVDRRMLVNRQRRLKMYRCWLQAVFRKPDELANEKSTYPEPSVVVDPQESEPTAAAKSRDTVSTPSHAKTMGAEAEMDSLSQQTGTISITADEAKP